MRILKLTEAHVGRCAPHSKHDYTLWLASIYQSYSALLAGKCPARAVHSAFEKATFVCVATRPGSTYLVLWVVRDGFCHVGWYVRVVEINMRRHAEAGSQWQIRQARSSGFQEGQNE